MSCSRHPQDSFTLTSRATPPGRPGDRVLSELERSRILAIHSILRDKDPDRQRLNPIRMPIHTGDYLRLSPRHREIFQPSIPDKIR